jgi:hypothetical protein
MNRHLPAAICVALVCLGLLWQGTTVEGVEAEAPIEAGHFIKYEITITPILEGVVTPTWMKFAFTTIEGTNATIQSTMHLSDGEEWDATTSFDMVSGSSTGILIPANTTIGDAVPIAGYGTMVIEGETPSIYTGIQRTTVWAQYANATDSLVCVWDKPTGILLAQNSTKNEGTMRWKVLETNIWQTQVEDAQPYQTLVYGGIVVGALLAPVLYLRTRKKKPHRRSAGSRIGSFPSGSPRGLPWGLRLERNKLCGGIPVDSGVFVEIGWVTAYSTGKDGRHGENLGQMGGNWA